MCGQFISITSNLNHQQEHLPGLVGFSDRIKKSVHPNSKKDDILDRFLLSLVIFDQADSLGFMC